MPGTITAGLSRGSGVPQDQVPHTKNFGGRRRIWHLTNTTASRAQSQWRLGDGRRTHCEQKRLSDVLVLLCHKASLLASQAHPSLLCNYLLIGYPAQSLALKAEAHRSADRARKGSACCYGPSLILAASSGNAAANSGQADLFCCCLRAQSQRVSRTASGVSVLFGTLS